MTRLASPRFNLIPSASSFTTDEAPSRAPEPPPVVMELVQDGRPDWQFAFPRRFRDDAISAVRELTMAVLLRDVEAEEAATLLLPYLAGRVSYAQRNLVFNAFMDFAAPQDIVYGALSAAEHDPRVLRIAAELLGHYGAEANPVLTRLAQSKRPECRYFIGAIFNMQLEERRREALLALTKHPDARTRQELLDEADRASSSDAALVCRRLELDPDEQIRESAREKLAYLES